VRTQSAEALALRGRPVAFRFFLEAGENGRFYKQELGGVAENAISKRTASLLR
jgi:hypothetical protein